MIASLVSDVFVFFNLMMAICLIALAPSVILVLLLRRFVVQGLSAGAVRERPTASCHVIAVRRR